LLTSIQNHFAYFKVLFYITHNTQADFRQLFVVPEKEGVVERLKECLANRDLALRLAIVTFFGLFFAFVTIWIFYTYWKIGPVTAKRY